MIPRYAIVGLGNRAYTFLRALLGPHAADGTLVGLCEANPGRLARAAAIAVDAGVSAPTYAASDFDRMLRETSPDCVIVTVPDYAHCAYIVRALELGSDVITEKPLTIDAESCRRIVAAQQASGRSVTVAFNYRYSPARSLLKQVLMSGIIGRVTAVNFEWQLDTYHGADYFRRWHRNKANSGGLFVHKATHHFDLLNWWLGSVPRLVSARGRRAFYRPETADSFGLSDRGPAPPSRAAPSTWTWPRAITCAASMPTTKPTMAISATAVCSAPRSTLKTLCTRRSSMRTER